MLNQWRCKGGQYVLSGRATSVTLWRSGASWMWETTPGPDGGVLSGRENRLSDAQAVAKSAVFSLENRNG